MDQFSVPELSSVEEAQALLAAIITSSDDAIISKYLDGTVRSWNQSAERIFGYRAEEIIGSSITVLFPPDRLDEESQILARLQKGERVDHFQTLRLRKDGTPVAVSVTISPVYDARGNIVGASKVARDVTRTAELEGKFEAIIASSDDAIVSKDLNGIVQSWNNAAERMFGYTATEMIGQSITKLFPPDRLDEEPKILEQLRRGQRVDHFETVRTRKDGRQLDVSVSISPIKDPTGRVIGVSKVARDISSIKRVLRDREELLERESAARAEAERVSRMKDEFLATLSHELRTPLNSILGWATILRSGGATTPNEMEQGIEIIERNARAQAQLIEELLDMSRVINGKLRLDVQPVDLQVVISEAIESVRPAAEGKEIRLTKVLDPKGGPIAGDPNRLQQVLWNLLTNAIKFTPKKGRVQVFLRRVNSHVEISVVDSGEGISAEFLPHLFTRFSQADTSISRQYGGLGLGLALVKSLAELHGGSVQAFSPGRGQGSTFTVSLPLSAVHRDESQPVLTPAPSPKDPQSGADFEGFHVLVVDDDPDARNLIQHILTKCNATVTTAASAAEGLAAVKQHRPDMVLSDIGMPIEDGYEFLIQLRQLSEAEGGDTPAVALTAFARSEDRRRALLAGFQMHLPKPVEATELLAVASNLCASSRRAKSRR
ncbi:PAS domain S-box protein [Anatilimnocola floriformis]|uniref:PAS domain S-box protein n=1 Tax=Anatilimnocola floriformis TaxID=2948575 RepID=UPI0020C3CD69|nr:PAS domain S-box protein [Anatilimnocola floriformis]